MKILVRHGDNTTTYTEIKNIRFAPQVSIVGIQSFADTLEVDVYTEDEIQTGWKIELRDEYNYVYAYFYITSAERKTEGLIHLVAQSPLIFLETKTCEPVMCQDETVSSVISDLTQDTGVTIDIAVALASKAINGFLPEQSARERLTWVAFVAGGYITTSYTPNPYLLEIDTTETTIPLEKVFWRPSLNYDSYVTAVQITSYTYPGNKGERDQVVVDKDGVEWNMRPHVYTLTNTNAPENIPENIVSVSGIGIVKGQETATTLLNRLGGYYFNRMTIEADVINNKEEFMTGDRYSISLDDENVAIGYCESLEYSFGMQIRSKMKLSVLQMIESEVGKLTVKYISQSSPTKGMTLATRTYKFPVGYQYTIEALWVDTTIENNRFIFRPAQNEITGTMTSGNVNVVVNCYTALRLYLDSKILEVISVDGVDEGYVTSESGNYTIAVIKPSEVD